MTVEEEPQRTIPVWVFKVLSAMYFIRCILLLSYMAMSLIYISNETYFLTVFIFLGTIFVEMLGGFLFLTRRFSAKYLALFYVVTGTISPYPILGSISYFVFFLPRIHAYVVIPTYTILQMIIGASHLIEITVFVLLGLKLFNKERVRDSSE